MEVVDKSLLEILACPDCYSSLKFSGGKLVCLNELCGKDFSVEQGIPILLPSSKLADFKQDQINFFDRWSSRKRGRKVGGRTSFDRFFSPVVGEKGIAYSEEEMRKVIKSLPENPLILEVGCGAGEHTAFLARLREDSHLVAIDLSLKSAVETRGRVRSEKEIRSKVSLIVADAEFLPFRDGMFDGSMNVMLFHHMASLGKSFKEIRRTLSPNGTALIVDLIADNPIVVWPRKIFPHLPLWVKKKWGGDYLLEGGEMPAVLVHSSKEFHDEINEAGLRITKEERFDLFVLALGAVGFILPYTKYFFPRPILEALYYLDKKLVRVWPFRKFAGAISLWLSH